MFEDDDVPEDNYEEWSELRGRIDSLASAVFFIAGGALTLSVSVLVGLGKQVDAELQGSIEFSWRLLLGAIVGFVFLKVNLIAQAFMRGRFPAERFNRTIFFTNSMGWLLGLGAVISFVAGMYYMVEAALLLVFSTQ